MKRIFRILLLFTLVTCLLIGCDQNSSQSLEVDNTHDEQMLGGIPLSAKDFNEISIRWGDGTLFVINDDKIIKDFFDLTSGIAYKLLASDEDKVGYLYTITFGDMKLDNSGVMNGKYEMEDKSIMSRIEELLFDYLPFYNYGKLEFQSDIVPDSHLYIVVKVDKTEDGILYFTKYENDYGFLSGKTEVTEVYESGDLLEIETTGRIPKGDAVEIMAYSINKMND